MARWAKQNIEDNPFAIEGEDYIKEGNTFLLSLRFAKILTMNTMTKEASEIKVKLLERDEKAMKIINSFSKVEVDLSGSILSYKDGDLYITSLAIASLTGKEHFHVIRDIREEALKLQEEIDLSKSGLISGSAKEPLAYKEILRGVKESHYLDEQGRRYPCYELSESAAYQMMLKYSFKFRALVIYEFQQMRKNLMKMMQVSLIENAFPELAAEKQHVYVIRNTLTENLKIGVSKDPEKRLATLQTGSDAELTLEYKSIACSNALQIEAEVHKLLKDYHVRGEWFSASLEQVEACLSRVSYQLSLPTLEYI